MTTRWMRYSGTVIVYLMRMNGGKTIRCTVEGLNGDALDVTVELPADVAGTLELPASCIDHAARVALIDARRLVCTTFDEQVIMVPHVSETEEGAFWP